MTQLLPATTPTPGSTEERSGRLGCIVAASSAIGLVAALLLVACPLVPVNESAIAGAALCGFALGWAALFLLSLWFTDQPQRWAVAPALFMGIGGLLLVAVGSHVREVLSWVWPPALIALVVWMLYRTRRDMRSRSGRVQLYLVFAILAISAVGGGYETVGEETRSNALPANGRLIDVAGHELYLSCVGSGSPTVVLEPGAGGTSAQLGWITPAVARNTRVCVYDRAGRGWSESADSAQDGAQIAPTCTGCCTTEAYPGRTSWPASRRRAGSAALSTSTRGAAPRPMRLPLFATSATNLSSW